jgi:hypothetical protein
MNKQVWNTCNENLFEEDSMKKCFPPVLVFVLTFAIAMPVKAQEKTMEDRVKALEQVMSGWSIYGSIRFATFYSESNSDFTSDQDKVTSINPSTPSLSEPDQKITQWALANNSRVGIGVDKKDNFAGRVELGLKNDSSVGLRLAWGTYTQGGATFLFGQDYTPLSDWDYSTQVYNADNNLKGWGIIDVNGSSRLPQVKFKADGLQVALVYPKGAVDFTSSDLGDGSTNEVLLPTLQARYRLKTDLFFADVFGGYGTFKAKSEILDISKRINSYTGGVGGGITIAPVYLKGMVWYARNGKQMSLHQADAAGASIQVDGTYTRDDDMGWAAIVGASVAGFGVEAGYGFVSSDQNADDTRKNKAQSYYANVTIPIAQNEEKTEYLILVPEVGVFDYMKDAFGNDQGRIFYAGAKWQLSF